MKIAVDIFGGDNAPEAIIKGCVLALNMNKEFSLIMVGKEDKIKALLASENFDKNRVEILDAQDIITNDEVPTDAIKRKTESSLVKCLDRVKSDSECVGMVSAGSTGAVLVGATLRIGRIRGINRPALAPLLPTLNGGNVLLIDCGANVDSKPEMLEQFAFMGSAYMKAVCSMDNPRVALLSNGTEDKKGNELTKATFPLLRNSALNFVGNMEARELLSGDYDVVVSDGFSGNIALKASEGMAKMILKMLKKEIYSGFKSKLAGAMLKKNFKRLQNTLDYTNSGGALFVGVEKIVIKSHGSSNANSICGSIMQVVTMHKFNLIEKIKAELVTVTEK